jgi:hypothetical protein
MGDMYAGRYSGCGHYSAAMRIGVQSRENMYLDFSHRYNGDFQYEGERREKDRTSDLPTMSWSKGTVISRMV